MNLLFFEVTIVSLKNDVCFLERVNLLFGIKIYYEIEYSDKSAYAHLYLDKYFLIFS